VSPPFYYTVYGISNCEVVFAAPGSSI